MSELLTTAAQNNRNEERVAAWRERYHVRFNSYPTGSIRRHKRLCWVDDFQRYFRRQLNETVPGRPPIFKG